MKLSRSSERANIESFRNFRLWVGGALLLLAGCASHPKNEAGGETHVLAPFVLRDIDENDQARCEVLEVTEQTVQLGDEEIMWLKMQLEDGESFLLFFNPIPVAEARNLVGRTFHLTIPAFLYREIPAVEFDGGYHLEVYPSVFELDRIFRELSEPEE